MVQRTFLSIVVLLFLSVNGASQIARDADVSVRRRAERIEPFIRASAARYGIDPQLLRILCFIESRYRLDAISPKGARGPMQFMPDTAMRYGLRDPHDPQQAIDAAARYLRDLLMRFGGRIDLALAAYNAGGGTVQSFRTGKPLMLATGKIINRQGLVTGGIPPYRETQEYVRSIISLLGPQSPKSEFANKPNRPSRGATEREDSFIEIQ
ncbi:MAG: lytic transglycosylase domain-containing protein [Pyrinomonadaceae bacterium]